MSLMLSVLRMYSTAINTHVTEEHCEICVVCYVVCGITLTIKNILFLFCFM